MWASGTPSSRSPTSRPNRSTWNFRSGAFPSVCRALPICTTQSYALPGGGTDPRAGDRLHPGDAIRVLSWCAIQTRNGAPLPVVHARSVSLGERVPVRRAAGRSGIFDQDHSPVLVFPGRGPRRRFYTNRFCILWLRRPPLRWSSGTRPECFWHRRLSDSGPANLAAFTLVDVAGTSASRRSRTDRCAFATSRPRDPSGAFSRRSGTEGSLRISTGANPCAGPSDLDEDLPAVEDAEDREPDREVGEGEQERAEPRVGEAVEDSPVDRRPERSRFPSSRPGRGWR